MADITLHIDENITGESRNILIEKIRQCEGVSSVQSSNSQSHLLIVNYDSKVITSAELLDVLMEQGLHGELVGM